MLLACLVAAVHAAAVVLMLTGALLALRWPRVLLAHVPVSLAILAVNLVGADCPLTTLERELRERAGGEVYGGGFLDHYVVQPLGLDLASASVQTAIYLVAVLPNVVGYGLLATRAHRRRATTTAARGGHLLPRQGQPSVESVVGRR